MQRESAVSWSFREPANTGWANGLGFVIDEKRHLALSSARWPLWRRAAKRVLDIGIASLSLLFLLPLLIIIAVTIRTTSPGPALFVQWRPGRDGVMFPLLKFRTMHSRHCDPSGIDQAVRGDRRVTPFGAWLRRSSIDELPQLINVLMGHMALVGPRPHPEGIRAAGLPYEDVVPCYRLRLGVRPGLSGWAQVNGYRGPTIDRVQAIARIEHDLAYMQNFSLLLDIRIILVTLVREFITGTGS